MNEGGTAAPAATPAPAPAASPAPAPAPAPAPSPSPSAAPAAAAFYDGIGNADLKTWVAGKGWSNIEAMATSHQNLEKLIGAPADEIVRIGKTPDAATIRNLQTKLGLPADPAKYEFAPNPEGLPVDQALMEGMRGAFHQAGLTNDQVKAVTAAYNQMLGDRLGQTVKDYDLNVEADIGKLRSEWGSGYDAQMARAAQTKAALGIPDTVVDAMETAMGYGEVMRFFAGLSSKFSEDTFRSGGTQTPGFGMQFTPAEARSELNRLMADKNFQAALMTKTHPQHKDALARKSQLSAMMTS